MTKAYYIGLLAGLLVEYSMERAGIPFAMRAATIIPMLLVLYAWREQ